MITKAFWDSSMLVPLCAKQAKTHLANNFFSKYQPVVWWGTRVEIVSALTRLKRAGEISELDYPRAKRDAFKLISGCAILQPSPIIESLATDMLEKYPLRAGDALQLAAAFEWCEGEPDGHVFLTADRRLADAAELAGFTLEPGLI